MYISPLISDMALRAALREDIKGCSLSREEIGVWMTPLVGRTITRSMVAAWAADTNSNRIPAAYVAAWVRVTKSSRLLDLLCSSAGLHLGDDTEHELALYGRAVLESERLHKGLEGRI